MSAYKTGWDPRERGKQLTICFDEFRLTAQMVNDAVETLIGKNYTFFVHPEMLEDVDKMFDFKPEYDILKVNGGTPNEDISKVMPAEDAALGFDHPNNSASTNIN